jgi:hypothetical protein
MAEAMSSTRRIVISHALLDRGRVLRRLYFDGGSAPDRARVDHRRLLEGARVRCGRLSEPSKQGGVISRPGNSSHSRRPGVHSNPGFRAQPEIRARMLA